MSGPVLLVHDDIGTIAAVRRVLTRAGHEVVLATSAADALIAFGHHLPSMVVLGPSVESGRGKVILDELAQHPSGSEARVLLLGEEVEGYLYPVVPLPLDGASFLELFESALAAPAYAQPPPPASVPSLEDTLFGDLPPEDPSSEQRAHAAVELAMEQAHQELEAEAVAELDASLARAGSEQEWDPFASATSDDPGGEESPPPAEGDEELLRLEAEVLEEAARRRQARLAAQSPIPEAAPTETEESEQELGAFDEDAFAEAEPTPTADPDLDFGELSAAGTPGPASPSIAPEQPGESEEEQVRTVRRAALLQAQREAKEARIRLAELRAERENDGAGIQLESDALLQQKQKEWAEREERIRHYEALRQERLRQAEQGAEVARELATSAVQQLVNEEPELLGDENAVEEVGSLSEADEDWGSADPDSNGTSAQGSEYATQGSSEYATEQGGSEYETEQGDAADQSTGYSERLDTALASSELVSGQDTVPDEAVEPEVQEGNEGDLLLTDVFASASEAPLASTQDVPSEQGDLGAADGSELENDEELRLSSEPAEAPNVLAQEVAHQRAAFEISEAIAEEVGEASPVAPAADSEPEPTPEIGWSPPELPASGEAEADDADADTGGWSLQEDLATAAPVALQAAASVPEPDQPDPGGAPSDLLHQHSRAQAVAAAQAQAVEEEVSAAARAEREIQQVSARGQVSSAAAARALQMARAAEQEAREAERRQAEAERLEREAEKASRRELVEQTRRAVELEAQARREREERERLAAELKAQAERDQEERRRLAAELEAQAGREREERDRIAAELRAQAERERLERQRLEQSERERAVREEQAQAERDRLAEELRLRELAEAQAREEREQEARILAEHARQEREARERLEQQLQEQLKHEREERERAARELEAAQEAARTSEERARTALLQVDEEKQGREEQELSRRLAEAEAEKARAEAREMAARAEAALVAIPKEKGIIERVARTGIAPLEKLAELIRDLTSARVDVRLELKADDALRILWLRGGGIAGALSTAPGETLLDRARQDGLIDPTQLRRLAAYKDRPASDQLATLREQGLLRESEVIPLVQRYTEAVALAAFSEAGSLYRLATEAIPADVPLAASTRPVIHLLAEGLRRGADPAAVLAGVGGLRAIPVRKRSDLDPERLELSERERRLLEAVDGVATLESLLLGAGVRQDAALRLFVVARALGLLELMPASEPTAADPQPELEVQRLNAKLNEIRDADYFTVLGVPRSAGKDEVLRAFELLSTEFHPLRFSTHPDPGVPRRAEELFSVLSEAVAALGDDRLRGQYARNLAD